MLPALASAPTVAARPGRVAVLVSRQTGSSGEMVALALRGRAESRIFGEQTAGLTTANTVYPLPHGGLIAVATERTRDAFGKRYDGPILPDQVHAALEGDAGAARGAAHWIMQGCKARSGAEPSTR